MINSKQSLIILFIIALFILFLPYFFRFANDNNVFIGSEPHYHARIASDLAENPFTTKDQLLDIGYRPNPYHYLLAACSFVLPLELVSIFLPILLGILSLLFLYLIFSDLKFKYLRYWFILAVFVVSPIFISIFSLSTPRALTTFLLIIGFYLFQKPNKRLFILSLIPIILLFFIGINHLFLFLIILLVFCLYNKKFLNKFYIVLIIAILILFGFHLPFYLLDTSFSPIPFTGFISDLGGIYGFSIFSLLLSILGLFLIWKNKKKFYPIYLLMFFLVIFSFFTKSLFIYSNLVVSFFAGSAFYILYIKKWKLKPLRNFALLVIFCGFLFSVLSHTIILSELPPNDDFVACLEWSSKKTPVNSRFLTHQLDSSFVEFWAERPVLLNEFHLSENLLNDVDIIWNSFDIRETEELLLKHKIDYIVVHEDLFDGLIWDNKYQGLYFLLDNTEMFKRRYHNNYCEIWELTDSGD